MTRNSSTIATWQFDAPLASGLVLADFANLKINGAGPATVLGYVPGVPSVTLTYGTVTAGQAWTTTASAVILAPTLMTFGSGTVV